MKMATPKPTPSFVSLLAHSAVLMLALTPIGCDQSEDPVDDETSASLTEAEPEAEAVPARIPDGDGFVLETALDPPERLVQTRGEFTLSYVGPHRYVTPDEDIVEWEESPDSEESDGPSPGIRLVDEQGHEWSLSGLDREAAAELTRTYREGRDEIRALAATDGHTNLGDIDDLAGGATHARAANWTEFTCGSSTKWRFNNGTNSDLEGMNSSQRRPILDTNGTGFSGTAVLVANNLALTAGHVASALVVGDSMCRRYSTSSTQCRSVSQLAISGDGGGNDDWGLIKFSSSFTGNWTYQLSDHPDGQINNHTPRIAAYPSIRWNEEPSCGFSSLLEGERNLGNYHALLNREARVDLTAGGGSSGAPYYFYEDGEYWIFGVHSGRRKTTLGNRYARGPKVPFWLPQILGAASVMGVSL